VDPVENSRSVAQELVSLAQQQGFDLEPFRHDFAFLKDRRWIELWRKDELPCSGSDDEENGTLHYSMQGTISALPSKLKSSTGAFRGVWHETGTLADLGQAFEFLKAWLIDEKSVDDLPSRSVRSYGI
jgi:hypothetical protein